MSEETTEAATREFSAEVKELGDKIAGLTLKTAQELVDYLKEAHGIEPAAGGVVMAAAPGAGGEDGGEQVAEKTIFDVELTEMGGQKLQVIKVVRAVTQLSLKEAKEAVESAPTILKEGQKKEEAEELKAKLEEVGAKVTLK